MLGRVGFLVWTINRTLTNCRLEREGNEIFTWGDIQKCVYVGRGHEDDHACTHTHTYKCALPKHQMNLCHTAVWLALKRCV